MLSQSSVKSYHKTQIDPERLAPAVYYGCNRDDWFEFQMGHFAFHLLSNEL